jgi:hypothetical protein
MQEKTHIGVVAACVEKGLLYAASVLHSFIDGADAINVNYPVSSSLTFYIVFLFL